MNALAEAQTIAREIGGQGNHKVRIGRVRRRLGCTYNRAKDILYGDRRIKIHAEEIDRLRSVKHEIDSGRARLAALRESLAHTDAEFHCETIAALDRALRALGGGD